MSQDPPTDEQEHAQPAEAADQARGIELTPLLSQPLPVASVQLEIRVGECPACMNAAGLSLSHPPISLRILTMEQWEFGWLAEGKVAGLVIDCDTCGMLYAHLVRIVPIECREYPCPKCGASDDLKYDVVRVAFVEGQYEFVAQFTCSSCSKRRRLRRSLRNLNLVKKLKIGPSGVEIERADPPGLSVLWKDHWHAPSDGSARRQP